MPSTAQQCHQHPGETVVITHACQGPKVANTQHMQRGTITVSCQDTKARNKGRDMVLEKMKVHYAATMEDPTPWSTDPSSTLSKEEPQHSRSHHNLLQMGKHVALSVTCAHTHLPISYRWNVPLSIEGSYEAASLWIQLSVHLDRDYLLRQAAVLPGLKLQLFLAPSTCKPLAGSAGDWT